MTNKTISFITFCAHWPEFLRKVFKVGQFNIVLDRDKAFCLYRKSPLIRRFPLANSPSFIYPAVLIEISEASYYDEE